MEEKLTLEQIQKDTLWIVRYESGYKRICTYSEIDPKNTYIRSIDIYNQQPAHLQLFLNFLCTSLENGEEFIKEKIFQIKI